MSHLNCEFFSRLFCLDRWAYFIQKLCLFSINEHFFLLQMLASRFDFQETTVRPFPVGLYFNELGSFLSLQLADPPSSYFLSLQGCISYRALYLRTPMQWCPSVSPSCQCSLQYRIIFREVGYLRFVRFHLLMDVTPSALPGQSFGLPWGHPSITPWMTSPVLPILPWAGSRHWRLRALYFRVLPWCKSLRFGVAGPGYNSHSGQTLNEIQIIVPGRAVSLYSWKIMYIKRSYSISLSYNIFVLKIK